MMPRRLTDRQMLSAAQAQLDEHLATRPATVDEALSIADALRGDAAQLRDMAALLRRSGTTLDLQGAGRLINRAGALELRAECWERIARDPVVHWQTSRAEYQARVNYYRRLVNGNGGA